MADNMMRIAGRDPENGVAKALSVTVDPEGNGVLRVHEAAPWVVTDDGNGNVTPIRTDGNGVVIVDTRRPTTCGIQIVTCTSANTEYSNPTNLPLNVKKLRISVRDGVSANKLRLSWVLGKVATSTEPYLQIAQDKVYEVDDVFLASYGKIFFASTLAGVVVQIEYWY